MRLRVVYARYITFLTTYNSLVFFCLVQCCNVFANMRTALFWVITLRIVVISYYFLQLIAAQQRRRAQFSTTSLRKTKITHTASML
jgi:ABC-type transport system involved in cytochrome bd biosynthesis fused ATPase/permease subunit